MKHGLNPKPMRINYTKIVATLGPSSESTTTIEEMIQAGMDTARLNFSHGTYENFTMLINNVRKAAKKQNKTIAILQDLQGPKIRLGILPEEGIQIKNGEKIILSTKIDKFTENKKETKKIPVQYKALHKEVKKNDKIYIDDGLIQVEVLKITGQEILCGVKTKGILFSKKGINAPDSNLSAKSLSPKDLKDLNFGVSAGVDFVALSFVKSAKDILELRKILKSKGSHAKIIAKIERREAIDNLEEIIQATDGVMVARGDLGIEIKPEQVPIVQKRIIRLSNRYAKPVITATQVLASMVENPRPTRAEISDAANAVFDNTDAIMLSNESAVGKYPVKSVQTLAKVISAVENELKKHLEVLKGNRINKNFPEQNPTCLSACELAVDTKSNKIIVYSEDGFTTREVAKHRAFVPIIAITPNKHLIQELALLWGVNKSLYKKFTQQEKRGHFTNTIINHLLKIGEIQRKEKIVVVFNAKKRGSVASLTV